MSPKSSSESTGASRKVSEPSASVSGQVAGTPAAASASASANKKIWDQIDADEVLERFEKLYQQLPEPVSAIYAKEIEFFCLAVVIFVRTLQGKVFACLELLDETSTGRMTSFFGTDLWETIKRAEKKELQSSAVSEDTIRRITLDLFRRYYFLLRKPIIDAGRAPIDAEHVQRGVLGLYACDQICYYSTCRRMAVDTAMLAALIQFAARTSPSWKPMNIKPAPLHLIAMLLRKVTMWEPKPLCSLFPRLWREFRVLWYYCGEHHLTDMTETKIPTLKVFIDLNRMLNGDSALVEIVTNVRKAIHKQNLGTQVEALSILDSCDVCHRQESLQSRVKKCGKCGVARYCSEKCQKEDWTSGGHHERCFNAKADL